MLSPIAEHNMKYLFKGLTFNSIHDVIQYAILLNFLEKSYEYFTEIN